MRSSEGTDEHTRVVNEIWSMMVHTLPSPPIRSLWSCSSPTNYRPHISPAAFGALFIGISMALMLFGVTTFVIGFLLMPLVIMLVLLFYFAQLVSKLLEIGRAIICPATSNCSNYKVAPIYQLGIN